MGDNVDGTMGKETAVSPRDEVKKGDWTYKTRVECGGIKPGKPLHNKQ